jgi:hypothetical protein
MRQLIGTVCLMTSAALFAATGFSASPNNRKKPPVPTTLVGAVVVASDGIELGQVLGISTGPRGRIERIRVATRQDLERTVIVAEPAFTLRGGVVVLELSGKDFERLPTAMTHDPAAR